MVCSSHQGGRERSVNVSPMLSESSATTVCDLEVSCLRWTVEQSVQSRVLQSWHRSTTSFSSPQLPHSNFPSLAKWSNGKKGLSGEHVFGLTLFGRTVTDAIGSGDVLVKASSMFFTMKLSWRLAGSLLGMALRCRHVGHVIIVSPLLERPALPAFSASIIHFIHFSHNAWRHVKDFGSVNFSRHTGQTNKSSKDFSFLSRAIMEGSVGDKPMGSAFSNGPSLVSSSWTMVSEFCLLASAWLSPTVSARATNLSSCPESMLPVGRPGQTNKKTWSAKFCHENDD